MQYNDCVALSNSFYVVEHRGWSVTYFVIIIAGGALCGANVGEQPGHLSAKGGTLLTDSFVTLALIPIELAMGYFSTKHGLEREDKYDTLDLLGPEFLTQDKGNFRLLACEIERIVFTPLKGDYSDPPLYYWTMDVHENSGATRTLWLTLKGSLDEVLALVRTLNVKVETQG